MMRSITLLFFFALMIPCHGQAFVQYYDHGTHDNFRRLRGTSDGGYILCGSQGGSSGQPWVLKVDNSGGEEWSQLLNGPGEAFDIQEVITGGYVLTGGRAGYDHGDSLSIWRMDVDGALLWEKKHAPAQPRNLGRKVLPLSTGGYLICGRTGLGAFMHDVLLLKVDEYGEMEWHRVINVGGLDEALQVLEHPEGGYMVLATTSSDGIYYEPLLIRVDQAGDPVWTLAIAGDNMDVAHQMTLTSAPGYLVVGRTATAMDQPGDVWLDHRDLQGEPLWSNEIGGAMADETGYDVVELPGGGYVIAVKAETVGWMETDAQGQLINEASADIGPATYMAGLVDPLDGSFVLAGNIITDTTFNGFHTNGFLLRTGFNGAMSTSEHNSLSISIYPNPASDLLHLSGNDKVSRMEISDMLGRVVHVIDHHERDIPVDHLRPGQYMLTITNSRGSRRTLHLSIQR